MVDLKFYQWRILISFQRVVSNIYISKDIMLQYSNTKNFVRITLY